MMDAQPPTATSPSSPMTSSACSSSASPSKSSACRGPEFARLDWYTLRDRRHRAGPLSLHRRHHCRRAPRPRTARARRPDHRAGLARRAGAGAGTAGRRRCAPPMRAAHGSRRSARACSCRRAAGLLDGKRATTHWRYAETLAPCFPASRFSPTSSTPTTATSSPPPDRPRASTFASTSCARISARSRQPRRPAPRAAGASRGRPGAVRRAAGGRNGRAAIGPLLDTLLARHERELDHCRHGQGWPPLGAHA